MVFWTRSKKQDSPPCSSRCNHIQVKICRSSSVISNRGVTIQRGKEVKIKVKVRIETEIQKSKGNMTELSSATGICCKGKWNAMHRPRMGLWEMKRNGWQGVGCWHRIGWKRWNRDEIMFWKAVVALIWRYVFGGAEQRAERRRWGEVIDNSHV